MPQMPPPLPPDVSMPQMPLSLPPYASLLDFLGRRVAVPHRSSLATAAESSSEAQECRAEGYHVGAASAQSSRSRATSLSRTLPRGRARHHHAMRGVRSWQLGPAILGVGLAIGIATSILGVGLAIGIAAAILGAGLAIGKAAAILRDLPSMDGTCASKVAVAM